MNNGPNCRNRVDVVSKVDQIQWDAWRRAYVFGQELFGWDQEVGQLELCEGGKVNPRAVGSHTTVRQAARQDKSPVSLIWNIRPRWDATHRSEVRGP